MLDSNSLYVYDEDGNVKRLEAVVCSTQHSEDVTQEQIHEDIKKYVLYYRIKRWFKRF